MLAEKVQIRYFTRTNLYILFVWAFSLGPGAGKGLASTGQTSQKNVLLPSEIRIEPTDVDPGLFFGTPAAGSEEYKLGPEDVLEVTVYDMEQINRTVRVAGDGSIDLPLIGAVRVAALAPDQAAARIAAKLGEDYVQNPQVSVFVKEFNSKRLSLLGAVEKPGTYALLGRRSLLQLLADAGGTTKDAGEVLYILRQSDDTRRARLVVPLRQLLVEGDPRWDIWLRPGDVVSVPPKEFIEVSILGAVERPGIYELPKEDASLLKALARAQWLNRRGSKKGLEIQRSGESGKEIILEVNLNDILSGIEPDVTLFEGDVIVVNEKFF